MKLMTLLPFISVSMKKGEKKIISLNPNQYFHHYYKEWLNTYKKGAIRDVTLSKYMMTLHWLEKLIPQTRIKELDRVTYQELLNRYAITHERQTTMDFHHQLKGAILDAVDEGIISRDPTRKIIIKGKQPRLKKTKFLSQFELQKLLSVLKLGSEISFDWLILLIAKTGLRFSEAIGITKKDFDFTHQSISINKTWNYKNKGGYQPTKNRSSNRKLQIDWKTVIQFSALIKDIPDDMPIFLKNRDLIYNSTANDTLEKRCIEAEVPIISIHGLRHTHASILLFEGVSIASVARRLGHASISTTQKTYLHVIQELENQDINLVMRSISSLI